MKTYVVWEKKEKGYATAHVRVLASSKESAKNKAKSKLGSVGRVETLIDARAMGLVSPVKYRPPSYYATRGYRGHTR